MEIEKVRQPLFFLSRVETLEKISALESELARLKAQIAAYALSEAQDIPEGEG